MIRYKLFVDGKDINRTVRFLGFLSDGALDRFIRNWSELEGISPYGVEAVAIRDKDYMADLRYRLKLRKYNKKAREQDE